MQRGLMQRAVPIAGALMLAACDVTDLVGTNDFRLLAKAEAQWKARPFADYTYEIQILCFCPPEITRWTRVTVQNGAVTDVEAVEPDPNYPITNTQYWEPIDSLFVDLRRTMTEKSSHGYLEALNVEYDPDLGYPTRIEYRAKANVIDGGSEFLLRNVTPIAGVAIASSGNLVPPEKEN